MSKPIKLTDDLLQKILGEFTEAVKKMKMTDGKITYEKSFKWKDTEDGGATVTFTSAAWSKMITLLQEFSSEVAWHGVVDYNPEVPNVFNIVDILVYPQLVDGSNVNTDQAEYTNWLYGLEDEVFGRVRMQGHSHVDFGTTPSAVDNAHQEQILSQLDDDMFYIFMIWNKKLEHTIRIFDMAHNTLYEDSDVTVLICDEGVDLNRFISDARSVVKNKPVKTAVYSTGKQKPKTPVSTLGAGWRGAAYGMSDYYGYSGR